MSFIREFKEFAVRGNVIDMAVGIIIGAAFGKIVSSLVADVLMPPIGLLISGVDFGDLALVLREANADEPAVVIAYGQFLQTTIDFLLVAVAVFLMIRFINRLKRKAEAAPAPLVEAAPSKEELLLTEIRDLLKQGS